jgi:hypothetical protein
VPAPAKDVPIVGSIDELILAATDDEEELKQLIEF